jgi:hypothetical protein
MVSLTNMIIHLHTGSTFKSEDLVRYIKSTGRNYIIQGQQRVVMLQQSKQHSLDFWLRQNATPRHPDVKLADNNVIRQLVATGDFQAKRGLICPDTGRKCKGLVLVNRANNK